MFCVSGQEEPSWLSEAGAAGHSSAALPDLCRQRFINMFILFYAPLTKFSHYSLLEKAVVCSLTASLLPSVTAAKDVQGIWMMKRAQNTVSGGGFSFVGVELKFCLDLNHVTSSCDLCLSTDSGRKEAGEGRSQAESQT